jgi:hypothetical protein
MVGGGRKRINRNALAVVSVIVVGQKWRGGLAIGGDPCRPDVAERCLDPGLFPVAFRPSHVYFVSRIPELALRIADFGLRIRRGGGRPQGGVLLSLIWLSKSGRAEKKECPLLLGRSCVFVAKKMGFWRGARAVSRFGVGDKKSFGCHALLYLGRCTFVATKVKRAGRRRGARRLAADWGLLEREAMGWVGFCLLGGAGAARLDFSETPRMALR